MVLDLSHRWPSGKAFTSGAEDLGSIPAFAVDLLSTSSHNDASKIAVVKIKNFPRSVVISFTL